MIPRNVRAGKKSSHRFLVLGFSAVLAVGAVIFLAENVTLYQKRAELEKRAANLRNQLLQLQQQQDKLKASIQNNQSIDYQEEVLREQGLYKKPGEEVVTMLPSQNEQSNAKPQANTAWWTPLQNLYNSIIGK